jgi:hypothetical protein
VGCDKSSQRLDSLAIGSLSHSDEQLATDTQHITSFERCGRLNRYDFLAVLANNRDNSHYFPASCLASRAGYDGKFIQHYCGVFDEAAIGAIFLGGDLCDGDAKASR